MAVVNVAIGEQIGCLTDEDAVKLLKQYFSDNGVELQDVVIRRECGESDLWIDLVTPTNRKISLPVSPGLFICLDAE